MTERRFRRSPRIVERDIRGERILVPIANAEEALDSLYTLNESAGYIWDRACDGTAFSEIVQAVVEEYGIDAVTAADDVASVLAELVEAGVLEPVADD